MKYGVADYGMNVWDGGNYDLEDRLIGLKEIGFNGIERLEATCAAEAIEKAALFRKYGMDFATVRISNSAQNIVYSAAMGKEYTWIAAGSSTRDVPMDTYIRRCKQFCKACAKYNLIPALHNHLGTVVESQDELDYFMKEVPEAWLLFDIGHHAGADGDVLRTLEKYYDRLVAIHFKDIFFKDAPDAKGWYEKLRFCELGGGSKPGFVPWQETAAFLKSKNYSKWVLVEHDTHLQDPFIDLKISIDHLKAIME